MFRLFLIVSFVGVAYGDTHDCVTDVDVALINATVTGVQTQLLSLFQDPANPTTGEVNQVLNDVCEPNSAPALAVKTIAEKVENCTALVGVTNLQELQIGPVGFNDLLVNFHGVTNFCDCVPSLAGVLTLAEFHGINMLTRTNTSWQYSGLPNYPVLCAPISQSMPVSLKNSIKTIYDNRLNCDKVYVYNSFASSDNIGVLEDMVTTCPENTTGLVADFNCVLDVSSKSGFKDCIAAATAAGSSTSDNVASTPKCKRRKCVEDHMVGTCTGTMSLVYMHAVEAVNKGTISLEDVCDSAGTVTASITLMLIAAIYSLFL
ncbi:hypothetical protein ACF0H5_020322 [Mactra antiquata]